MNKNDNKAIWKEEPKQEYHFGHIIKKLIEHPYGWTKVPLFSRNQSK